jgi:hypothetical protein
MESTSQWLPRSVGWGRWWFRLAGIVIAIGGAAVLLSAGDAYGWGGWLMVASGGAGVLFSFAGNGDSVADAAKECIELIDE